MTGEQHERAVEAGARALCEYGVLTVDGEVATWERHQRKLTQMAQVVLNGASLREQGVCLVDLREVLDTIRVETYGEDDPLARHARVVADFLERRFGGHGGSEG